MDRLKIGDVVESRDIGGGSRRTQRYDVVYLPERRIREGQPAYRTFEAVACRHAFLHERRGPLANAGCPQGKRGSRRRPLASQWRCWSGDGLGDAIALIAATKIPSTQLRHGSLKSSQRRCVQTRAGRQKGAPEGDGDEEREPTEPHLFQKTGLQLRLPALVPAPAPFS